MSKHYIYFVLNYTDQTTGKSAAHVLKFHSNNNLLNICNGLQSITNTKGETATLNIIHFCRTEQEAYTIREGWNKTYRAEKKHFDY